MHSLSDVLNLSDAADLPSSQPTDQLLADAPVKETATTPALEHAESAVVPAATATAPPAMVALAHATAGDHTDVVKPALEQPTEKATAPATTHASTETSSVPVAAAGEPVVPVGNAKIEEAKDVKEVAKDSAKEAKGEKKVSTVIQLIFTSRLSNRYASSNSGN